MAEWLEISEHIAADSLWMSTPPIIRYWVLHHYVVINMDSPRDIPAEGVYSNRFSDPRGEIPHDADIVFRDGAAGPPNLGDGSGDSVSDLAPGSYRSFPENDTCPSHLVLSGDYCALGRTRSIQMTQHARPVLRNYDIRLQPTNKRKLYRHRTHS